MAQNTRMLSVTMGDGNVHSGNITSIFNSYVYKSDQDAEILRWLADRVTARQILLGTDYSFPPADMMPLDTVRQAGFTATETQAIVEDNARRLFPRLPGTA